MQDDFSNWLGDDGQDRQDHQEPQPLGLGADPRTPDDIAQERRDAEAVGQPPAAVRAYPEVYAPAARAARVRQSATPRLSEWLSDNTNYEVAHDDVENLSVFERVHQQPRDVGMQALQDNAAVAGLFISPGASLPYIWDRLRTTFRSGDPLSLQQWGRGQRDIEMGRLNYQASQAALGRAAPLSTEQQDRLTALMDDESQNDYGGFLLGPTLRMAPQFFGALERAGRQAGRRAGEVADVNPEKTYTAAQYAAGLPLISVASLVAGFGGLGGGYLSFGYEMETGSAYGEMVRAGVAPEIAAQRAEEYGLWATAIEFASDATGLKLSGAGRLAARASLREGLEQTEMALIERPILRASLRAAEEVGSTAGEQGLEEATQQLAQIIHQDLAEQQSRTGESDVGKAWRDAFTPEHIQEMLLAGYIGAQGGAGMASVPASINYGLDIRAAQRAEHAANIFQQQTQAAQASLLVQRGLASSLQSAVGAMDDSQVFIDADQWVEFFQDAKADPYAMAENLGIGGETLAQALAGHAQVQLPTATFAARVLSVPEFAGLADHARIDPTADTPAEAKAVGARLQAVAEQMAQEIDEAKADNDLGDLVEERMRQLFAQAEKEGGPRSEIAAQYAKLPAAFARAVIARARAAGNAEYASQLEQQFRTLFTQNIDIAGPTRELAVGAGEAELPQRGQNADGSPVRDAVWSVPEGVRMSERMRKMAEMAVNGASNPWIAEEMEVSLTNVTATLHKIKSLLTEGGHKVPWEASEQGAKRGQYHGQATATTEAILALRDKLKAAGVENVHDVIAERLFPGVDKEVALNRIAVRISKYNAAVRAAEVIVERETRKASGGELFQRGSGIDAGPVREDRWEPPEGVKLTERERKIAEMAINGASNDWIAEENDTTANNIRVTLNKVMRKLRVAGHAIPWEASAPGVRSGINTRTMQETATIERIISLRDALRKQGYTSTSGDRGGTSINAIIADRLGLTRQNVKVRISQYEKKSRETEAGTSRISNPKTKTGTGGELNQFLGPLSNDADMERLERAAEMAEVGYTEREIWRETGWWRNPKDGKWRYELDDSRVGFIVNPENGPVRGKLVDVLRFPELFAAYPTLKDVQITLDLTPDERAYGAAQDNAIVARGPDAPSIMSVVLHEVQHHIQAIEGFASGGTALAAKEHVFEFMEELEAARTAAINEYFDGDRARYERSESADPALFLQVENLLQQKAATQTYLRLAGEIEARNVQRRRGEALSSMPPAKRLTAEQRKATPPSETTDIALDNGIVQFDDGAHLVAIRSIAAEADGGIKALLGESPAESEGSASVSDESARGTRSAKEEGAAPVRESRDFAPRRDLDELARELASAIEVKQGEKRGSIRYDAFKAGEFGNAVIRLGEASDLSTFLHEFGHLGHLVLESMATAQDAPQEFRSMWDATLQWWGVDQSTWDALSQEQKTERYELWARTFEAYLLEGKAPSFSLREAFATFKEWLKAIYNNVLRLNAKLTPEIRDVFDRLLATDQEIAEARAAQGGDFALAREAFKTDEEFQAYQQAIGEAKAAQEADLRARAMDTYARKNKRWWRGERERMRSAAVRAVDSDKARRALDWLAFNEVRSLPDTTLSDEGETGYVASTDAMEEMPEDLPEMRLSEEALAEQWPDAPLPVALKPRTDAETVLAEAMQLKAGAKGRGSFRAKRLARFIKDNGGIDLSHLTPEERAPLEGFGRKRPGVINNTSGKTPEELLRLAQEAGYFGAAASRELSQSENDAGSGSTVPGINKETLRESMTGRCFQVAQQLRRRTGWDLVAVRVQGVPEHFMVRSPDGFYYDARGRLTAEQAIEGPWFSKGRREIVPSTEQEMSEASLRETGRALDADAARFGEVADRVLRSGNDGGSASARGAENKGSSDGGGFEMFQSAVNNGGMKLTALHNLTPENLLNAAKLGGLPVPSIGVVPEGMGLQDIGGSITLIGRRNLADPAREPVYDADVWSPTFPRAEYNTVSSRKIETAPLYRTFKKWDALYGEQFRGAASALWDNTVNRGRPDEAIQSLSRDSGAMAAFLDSIGEKPIDAPIREKPTHHQVPWSRMPSWIEFVKATDWNRDNLAWDDPARQSLYDEAGAAASQAIEEYAAQRDPDGGPVKDTLVEALRHYVMTDEGHVAYSLLDRAREGALTAGQQEVDSYAAQTALEEQIGDRGEQFHEWLNKEVRALYAEPFIRHGRKKVPITLGNVVDIMTGRVKAQQDHLTFGEGKARAAGAKRFRDLEEMRRAAATQIRTVAEAEAAQAETRKLAEEWRNSLTRYYGPARQAGDTRDRFGATWESFDAAMRALSKVMGGAKTEANMERSLRREGFIELPPYVVEDGVELAKAMIATPVPYFEAKPQRAVGLNEFAGAVIPSTTPQAVRDVLTEAGVPFKEYDNKDRTAQADAAAAFARELGQSFEQGGQRDPGQHILFQPPSDKAPTLEEFLSALAADLRNERAVYSAKDNGALGAAQDIADAQAWFDKNGIDLTKGKDEIRAQIEAALEKAKNDPNAMHPDDIAPWFGFSSGDELIQALSALKPRNVAIEEEIDKLVEAEHGDAMSPDRIKAEAQMAAHAEAQARRIEIELAAIQKAAGGKVRPFMAAAKVAARDQIEGMTLREIQRPEVFLAGERRAARAAMEAVQKKDWDEAARSKSRQMVCFYLYSYARDATEQTQKMERRWKKYSTNTTTRAAIGPKHIEQIDAILDQIETGKPQFRPSQTLEEWGEELRRNDEADLVVFDPAVVEQQIKRPLAQMALTDVRGIDSVLKNIETIGRGMVRLRKEKEAQRISDIREELKARIVEEWAPVLAKKRSLVAPNASDKARLEIKHFDAQLLKLDYLARLLDGLKDGGPWMRLMAMTQDAENDLQERSQKATQEFLGITSERYKPREFREMLTKRIFIPAINDNRTRAQIISYALNVGNEYNLNALLKGEGWNAQQLSAVLSHLDDRDWGYVQSLWDYVGQWKEESFALDERTRGVRPEEVQALPFRTPSGKQMAGGYWPVAFDPDRSDAAAQRDARDTVIGAYGGAFRQPSTNRGRLKGRTDTGGQPLSSDFMGVLAKHVHDSLRDITHRDLVITLRRVKADKELRNMVARVRGKDAVRALDEWTHRLAARMPANVFGDYGRIAAYLRRSATSHAMGFKVSVATLNLLGHLQAIPRNGVLAQMKQAGLSLVAGFPDLLRRHAMAIATGSKEVSARVALVYQKSAMMRHRRNTFDRDINEVKGDLVGRREGSVLPKRVEDMLQYLNAYTDQVVSIPTWLAAYESALNGQVKGVSGEEASVDYADSVVRMTLSGGGTKDLSAIVASNNQWQRLATMFMGWANAFYNQMFTEQIPGLRYGKIGPAKFAANMVWIWLLPAVISAMFYGQAERRDDEDEWQYWMRMAGNVGTYPLQTIPFVRDLLSTLVQGYRPQTPFGAVLERSGKFKDAVERQDERQMVKQGMLLAGQLTGLPAQAYTTGDYVADWIAGEEDPMADPGDALEEAFLRDTR